jgi:DNA repair protein RecO (recombination protein O)
LPPCLTGGDATPAGVVQGLNLTGHFLARELGAAPGTRPLPEARARLVDLLARSV